MTDLTAQIKTAFSNAIENAVENSYYESLVSMTPEELAYDMMDCDVDIADLAPEGSDSVAFADEYLVPLARAWQQAQGSKETST